MSFKRKTKGAWAEALQLVLKRSTDVVPEGWLTSEQISKEMGVKIGQASKSLALMIKMGFVEKRKFRVVSRHGTGLVRPTEHYKLLKGFPASKK